MNSGDILVITFGAILILALLVVGGVTLQARSFTQLLELLHYLGSRLEANGQGIQQVQTILSNGTGKDTTSAPQDDSLITQDNQQP